MKLRSIKFAAHVLTIAAHLLLAAPARALEPQTLFNFRVTPSPVTGTLVQGPDGNFYGTTPQAGPTGNGAIFRVTPGGQLTTVASELTNVCSTLVVGNDGQLYGTTGADGGIGFGTVFRLNTNGTLTHFAVFDGTNGKDPSSGLVLAGDGNFYGVSPGGGTHSLGALFRITPQGVITLLVSFDGAAMGSVPVMALTVGPDGDLYGRTSDGGAAGNGTIFKVTLAGSLTTLHSFQISDGFIDQGRLTVGPDNNLYGTTPFGGTANLGTIFKVTTNGIFSTLISFNSTTAPASTAELTSGPGNVLFGTTPGGGSANAGTIFKVTTNGVLTTLFSFTAAANSSPEAGLLLARDGNFYGCSEGSVFKITPAGAFSTLAFLISLDGTFPLAGLSLGPDGNFYGTTSSGGTNNAGTIFKLTPNGALTSLSSFNVTNGQSSYANLTLGRDGNFYGTTSLGGGPANGGVVFRVSTNGALTRLVTFNGTGGASPQSQLVLGTDGNFYGTTIDGGTGQNGTVFRVATNGAFASLFSFNFFNGAAPQGGLVLGMDGNFYGTANGGGTAFLGTVFRVAPAGALTTLLSFNQANGQAPVAGLVQGGDGILYGTTAEGGDTGAGTIFKITTNGATTTLFHFHSTDGAIPVARMIFGPDGNLYGTTAAGGAGIDVNHQGFGTVFRITTNGAFTSLVQFQGTNGSNPQASLALGPDGNLYGTTSEGGAGGGGTIFRVALNNAITNAPPTVAIISPTNGASFIAPATITIQAAASDSDGTVTNVQFFDGTNSLGNVSSSPFNLSVSLGLGSHALFAIASDNFGATTTTLPVTVTVTANSPPTVAITSPTNGVTFIAPATITIKAVATDSDGSVTNIQFFDGATSLGSVSSGPDNLSVSLAVGSHALSAIASDNLGATTTSLPVTITVSTNSPPTIAITSPTNGASLITPATITIKAVATDDDGSVTNVQFFDGTTSLGNVSSSPYNLSVSLALGSHALFAIASDNFGATTTTLPVTVTVTTNTPPTIAITSPTNGVSFIAPATITIQAAASDSDGSVTNVEFFDGTTSLGNVSSSPLGNVSSSPYNLSVSLAVGSHALTAVASDNLGATTTTLPVTVIGLTETVISGVMNLPDGSFQFAFTNTPGASFTVLASTNITLPVDQWTSVGAALETTPGSYHFTDQTTSSPQRFYRIRSP